MSNREMAKSLIDKIPENKLIFIIPLLRGASIPDIEEAEPDEWDKAMIREAKSENNNEPTDIDTLAEELGVTL